MILNSMIVKSPFIGVPVSLLLLYVGSVAVGKIFFSLERSFLRGVLGFATFLSLLALGGVALILTARFTEILSLFSVVVIGIVFCFLSFIRKGVVHERVISEKPKSDIGWNAGTSLLVCLFLFSVAVSFYGLLLGRTGEGVGSVWLTIPNFFLPTFFLSSVFLMLILFFTRISISWKLVFVCAYSFLVHSLFLFVWYPGRYGDPWSHLGEARFIDKAGKPYAYEWMVYKRYIVDLIGARVHYALVVLLRRMFCLDIYWIHVTFVPLLWSFFVPLFSYTGAKLFVVGKSETVPLFAAVGSGLFSSLVLWGAVSVPNSLGFIFLLFTTLLLLYWIKWGGRRIWFLALLASAVTFLAHPQPGIFALTFFFLATVFRKFSNALLKVACYVLFIFAFPLALHMYGATFSVMGLLSLENFLSFQSDLVTLPFLLGVLGLLFGIWGKGVNGKSAVMLFGFYVMVVVEYYVMMYGMANVPFGPRRILVMADLLLVIFVALGLLGLGEVLEKAFSGVKVKLLKNVKISLNPRLVGMLLICVFLSSQATFTLYQAYPREEGMQPAAYELEAVYYINSTAPGPYVVLCDPTFASMAVGFLGKDYGYAGGRYGVFGVPDFSYPTIKMYSEMCKSPSASVMKQAMNYIGWATVCYFVVSIGRAGVQTAYDFERVLQQTSEILPVDNVFGNGKLYLFKYPVPIKTGMGPDVKVIFDDGVSLDYAPTNYSYTVKTEVKYTITLTGHESYNITDYPSYWTFLNLGVNGVLTPFDESSDINTFIYVRDLKCEDNLKLTWLANDNYPIVGWKEDSFKTGWQTNPRYGGTIKPDIVTDGNILSLSWNFSRKIGEYQYYYYTKSVNLSTNDYDFVLVRWNATGPIAYMIVYFESWEVQEIVTLGSESAGWTITTVQLPADRIITYVMVGITNLKNKNISGPQTLSVDYILVSAETG